MLPPTSSNLNHHRGAINRRDSITPDPHDRHQERQPSDRAPHNLLLQEALHLSPHLLAVDLGLLGLNILGAALAVRIRPDGEHFVASLHARAGLPFTLPLPLLGGGGSLLARRSGGAGGSGAQGQQIRGEVVGSGGRGGQDQCGGVQEVRVAKWPWGKEVRQGECGGRDGGEGAQMACRGGGEGIKSPRGGGSGWEGEQRRDGQGGE